MAHHLITAMRMLEDMSEKHQQLRTGPTPLTKDHMDVLSVNAQVYMALQESKEAYLATLPRVPAGYYIALCKDPEGPCIGWHCYRHTPAQTISEDPGHTHPTAEHYCDGSSPITLDWLMGRLTDIIDTES